MRIGLRTVKAFEVGMAYLRDNEIVELKLKNYTVKLSYLSLIYSLLPICITIKNFNLIVGTYSI